MPYVYEIYCKKLNKRYIGSRTKHGHLPRDILKDYFTSSSVVNLIIEQFGKDSFEVVNVIEFNSIEECIEYEDKLLKSIPKNNRINYLNRNFSAGGSVIKNQTHLMITDGNQYIQFPRDIQIPDGWKVKWSFKPPSNKGKIKIINPKTLKKSLSFPNSVPEGWITITEYKKLNKPKKKNIWITNGVENKRICNRDNLPEGWRFGKYYLNKPTGRQKGHSGSTTNKICVNNGIKNIFINKNIDIPVGYVKGMIK